MAKHVGTQRLNISSVFKITGDTSRTRKNMEILKVGEW
jgi:hypothetical protein